MQIHKDIYIYTKIHTQINAHKSTYIYADTHMNTHISIHRHHPVPNKHEKLNNVLCSSSQLYNMSSVASIPMIRKQRHREAIQPSGTHPVSRCISQKFKPSNYGRTLF